MVESVEGSLSVVKETEVVLRYSLHLALEIRPYSPSTDQKVMSLGSMWWRGK